MRTAHYLVYIAEGVALFISSVVKRGVQSMRETAHNEHEICIQHIAPCPFYLKCISAIWGLRRQEAYLEEPGKLLDFTPSLTNKVQHAFTTCSAETRCMVERFELFI